MRLVVNVDRFVQVRLVGAQRKEAVSECSANQKDARKSHGIPEVHVGAAVASP